MILCHSVCVTCLNSFHTQVARAVVVVKKVVKLAVGGYNVFALTIAVFEPCFS